MNAILAIFAVLIAFAFIVVTTILLEWEPPWPLP